ncbi:hypothetical protein [Marinospirillum insulare]|uniref:Thioredoxin-like fold domain-containing protein n=1 Tax=Marinospirillum insulare TaxID=217169 RepID=A0ABQ5ZZ51_9GAMM|nr:hypothetical protein [Marinospirillum insulare]GLR63946.1 hypothetical protein GCM10007878_13840 [Marinospirillum insulare]
MKTHEDKLKSFKNKITYTSIGLAAVIAIGSLSFGFLKDSQNTFVPLQEIQVASKNDWPTVFKEMDQEKVADMQVIKGFTTEIQEVTGWVLKERTREASQAIVYTVGNGSHAIIGGIVDSSGNNLSSKHFELFTDVLPQASKQPEVSKQSAPQADILNASLLQSVVDIQPVVKIGEGEREVVVVIDLNCPYCTQYFNNINADSELLKDFTFKFMPVGILSHDSVVKAAVFDDLSEAEAKQHLIDVFSGESLSIQPSSSALAASENRTSKWQQAGLTAAPTTIVNLGKENQKSKMGMLGNSTIKSLF